MKLSRLLPLCVAFTALNVGVAVSAAPFEIEENFDDSSLFPDGQRLPEGWTERSTYHFHRASASDTGQPTYSGSYMFGVSDTYNNDVFYTAPMECAAGQPFTIEFMARTLGRQPQGFINPGLKIYAGVTQDVSQMTLLETTPQATITEWQKFSFEFIPETDGEYCFAIQVYHPGGMDMLGPCWFDDFIFTGTTPEAPTPELEPNPDNLADCVELPYLEEFDGENYIGDTFVPQNWLTTGDAIWRTVNMDALTARSGSWYLVAPDNTADRNQRLYTPFFNLQENVEYTLTFYTHFEGIYNQASGQWFSTTMNVTVGTEQDADFHPVILQSISRNEDDANTWTMETVKFTPKATGPYCFCFQLEGPAYSGFVAMDDFYITSPNDIPRPIPDFNIVGTFNWTDSKILTTETTPIRLLNASRYADDFQWDLAGLEHNMLPDGSVDVFFTTSGTHSLKLTATNEKGSRNAVKEFNVTVINEDINNLPILSFDPGAVTYFDRGKIPCYDTDENGLDYVSGFNHYYRCLAEKFILPTDVDFNVFRISLWNTNLRYVPTQDAVDQSQQPFSLSLYGSDEEGNLDENKLLARKTTTMADIFGTTGIGSIGETRVIDFDTPAKANGTVYVAYEFSDNMKIDVEDPAIGRSFLGIGMVRHKHGQTTLHGKMIAAPEGSAISTDGTWYPVDALTDSAKGFGLNMQLWANATRDRSAIAINNFGETVFGVKSDSGILTVSGTQEGEYVAVYDLTGCQVALVKGHDGATTVDCTDLAKGTYIVSTNAGAAKFVR